MYDFYYSPIDFKDKEARHGYEVYIAIITVLTVMMLIGARFLLN